MTVLAANLTMSDAEIQGHVWGKHYATWLKEARGRYQGC